MMSVEDVDQLTTQLKTLRSDNELLRKLLSTIEKTKDLMTNQLNRCLCGQSHDTKFKTKLNVLNDKYDSLKILLTTDSFNLLTDDMIVIKDQQTIESSSDQQLDLLDTNNSEDEVIGGNEEITDNTNVIVKPFTKRTEKPNIVYISIENTESINTHEVDEEELTQDMFNIKDNLKVQKTNDEFCCDFGDSKTGILCGQRFISKELLLNHKKRHTTERPWFCQECHYTGVHRSHLIGHLRKSHTGRYQFSCDWPGCSFMGPSRYNIKRHKIIHTGEKPYKCNWPGCEWSSANNKLAEHRKIHTGERPYTCSWVGCEARFSRPFTLRNHMRTHTGEKPFICDYPNCNYRSAQQTPLTTHKRKHHNVLHVISEEIIISDPNIFDE
ncbi:zinc finger protein 184-like [Oppia nitens]|uniref:zinc finger protein 184-like n=1 Tax=Oppia nitens TaxID=1686743 RepID=UPI0023DB6FA8|nr:zinc finger protein 184-like [Oppia nitens]